MDRKHVFADKLELVTGFVFYRNGVIAATVAGHLVSRGHQRRRGRRQAHEALHRPRHRRHARRHQQPALGPRRLDLRHARLQRRHGDRRRTARRSSAATAAASSASSRTAARSSSTAAAAATPGGSTSPGTARCSGRSRRAARCSSTPCCRRACSPRARIPGTTSWKGMITGQNTYPLMTWPEQAYVQIDLVGQFTAAAGCAVYDGGAWPEKWRYAYFTGEPTLNIVHQQFVQARRRQLHDARRKPGREQTEFIRSTRSVVPADRDARRPGRRALRRRLLQPGRHPQRHARSAARSGERRRAPGSRSLLRPHLARAAQAGDEAGDAGAEPARPAGADAGDGDEPERPRQADGVAAGAGELRLRPAPRANQAADGQQGARRCTSGRARRRRPPSGASVLDTFARGHRQLDAVGDRRRRRPNRAGGLRRRMRSRTNVRRRSTDFVSRSLRRARCRPMPARLLAVAAAAPGPTPSPLKAARRPRRRADGRRHAGDGRRDDSRRADAARRSRRRPRPRCRSSRSGTRPAR